MQRCGLSNGTSLQRIVEAFVPFGASLPLQGLLCVCVRVELWRATDAKPHFGCPSYDTNGRAIQGTRRNEHNQGPLKRNPS